MLIKILFLGKPVEVDPATSQVQPDASCNHVYFSSIKYIMPSTTTSLFFHLHSDARDGGVVVDQTVKPIGGTLEPIVETGESLANESLLEKQGPPASETTPQADRVKAPILDVLMETGHA